MTNNEVICLKIEIKEGQFEYLKVYDEDEPDEIAKKFCEKHCLDSRIQENLSDLIEFHIDNMITSVSTQNSFENPFLSSLKFSNTSPSSSLISHENKLDLYYALFEQLSDSEYYKISFRGINLTMLPKSIQRILEPIIDELEESEDEIGFSEFTRAMDVLLPTLTARDRILLLNYYLQGSPKQSPKKKIELKKEIQNLKFIRNPKNSKTLKPTLQNPKKSTLDYYKRFG